MTTVALVSCVSEKLPSPAKAGELYTSTLFRKTRSYATSHADRWYILSAKYGLLDPDTVIEPYEKTLNKMRKAERTLWAQGVLVELLKKTNPGDTILFLAGERYREGLVSALKYKGYIIEIPMDKLPIGRQLEWLTKHGSL